MRKLRAAHLAAVLLGAGLAFISAIDALDALSSLHALDRSGAARAAHPNSLAGELVLADGVTLETMSETTIPMEFSEPPAWEATA